MKYAFWTLFAAGFIACSTLGIGPSLARAAGNWASPAMIAGSLLGVAILALAVMYATGARPSFLATDRALVVALGALIATKVGVSLVQTAVGYLARG
jgi:hypothetical protein